MDRSVGKVTCLITRQSDRGREVVVFEHPHAGVQLPAGTMLAGELASAGALREGWEETGIPGLRVVAELAALVEATPGCGYGRLALDTVIEGVEFTRGHAARVLDGRDDRLLVEVVGKQGWIAKEAFCDDVVRHIVQLESDAPTPDEWWVVTPDGGGLCWRCHWVPIDDDTGLVEGQAEWLAIVRDELVPRASPAPFKMPDHPLCNESSHLQFWAFPWVEKRFIVSWIAAGTVVDDRLVRRSLAACRTDDGRVVLVSGNGRTMWNFPGGGREPGETVEQTAVREVSEEACADVIDLHLIGYQHVLHLDDGGTVVDEELQARFAALVDVRPWDQRFEISGRRVVAIDVVRPIIGTW